MEPDEIDFIINCLKKYLEYYLSEDHGFCGTGVIMQCQAVNSCIDELINLKIKEINKNKPEGCNND